MTEKIKNENIEIAATAVSDTHSGDYPTQQTEEITPHPPMDAPASQSSKQNLKWVDVVIVVMLFFVSQIVGGTITSAIGIRLPGEAYTTSFDADVLELADAMQSRFVAFSFLFSMVFCFIGLVLYKWIRHWPRIVKLHTPLWSFPLRLLIGYFVMWAVSISIEPLAALLPGDQEMLGGGGWLLFSAVILAPIFEETIFRGYVAGILRSLYGGLTAWLVSAILFGAAHLIPSVIVSATACGLVLGFYYLRFRSLLMVIILHAMNNLTACFLRAIDMEDVTLRSAVDNDIAYWGIYSVCLIVSIVSFIRMARVMARTKSDKTTNNM